MRVLFTTWAWRSHLYAMVPLAWACRSAGHEVLVASQPGFVDEIVRTGLPGAGVGYDVDAVGMVRDYLVPTSAPRDGDRVPRALKMLLAHAESMLDGLAGLARRWRPDLLVYETTTLAGPIAAAAVGIPAVRHLYGPDLLWPARKLLREVVAPLAEPHGVTEFDPFGITTVDPTPRSLRTPTDLPCLPVRYTPFNGTGTLPDPLTGRVCVTWGHTIAEVDPDRFFLPRVVEALSGWDVVAAVSAAQAPLLSTSPGTRVVVDTPLHHVVPHCDLVIAHGGAGTTLTALRHGLPLLLIPQLPDHVRHADRARACGAAAVLTADEASPERLRETTANLLGDGSHRAAADGVRREILESPPPAELVPELLSHI